VSGKADDNLGLELGENTSKTFRKMKGWGWDGSGFHVDCVLEGDTEEPLSRRILVEEHRLYWSTIQSMLSRLYQS